MPSNITYSPLLQMIELPSPLTQSELIFSLNDHANEPEDCKHDVSAITTSDSSSVVKNDEIELHVAVQTFADAIWVIVGVKTANCAPGIILRYAANVQLDDSPAPYLYNVNDLPSVECEVLLGIRDEPLTNMLASSIVHELLRCATHYRHSHPASSQPFHKNLLCLNGQQRQILMCLNVAQCAKKLRNIVEKKRFLTFICSEVIRLLTEQQQEHVRNVNTEEQEFLSQEEEEEIIQK